MAILTSGIFLRSPAGLEGGVVDFKKLGPRSISGSVSVSDYAWFKKSAGQFDSIAWVVWTQLMVPGENEMTGHNPGSTHSTLGRRGHA